jgi:hypothetical protein
LNPIRKLDKRSKPFIFIFQIANITKNLQP